MRLALFCKFEESNSFVGKAIFLFSALFFLVLLFHGFSLYPSVFADEYTYSKFSRILPFDQADIPGYLYFVFYSTTNLCGDGFLACAKLLNAFFYICSVPFIYLIAGRFCTPVLAAFFALIAMVAPFGSYTAYFMPESMFFLFFCVVSWAFFRIEKTAGLYGYGVIGVLVGLFSLVKPHALFVVPAYVIYILFANYAAGYKPSLSFKKAFVFLFSLFSMKFGFGFLAAGTVGVNLFGAGYSSIADSAVDNVAHYLSVLSLSLVVFKGHFLAICFLFGVPLVSMLYIMGEAITQRGYCSFRTYSVYVFLVLGSLVAVTCLFTASVAGAGPYETTDRLHLRYYSFVFPLLALLAIGRSSDKFIKFSVWRLALGAGAGLGILWAVLGGSSQFVPSHVDNPEWFGVVSNVTIFYTLGVVSLVSVVLWVWRPAYGGVLYLFVFFPIFCLSSSYFVAAEQRQHRFEPDLYDEAGLLVRHTLSPYDRQRTAIVGSAPGAMFRTLFYFDSIRPPGEALRVVAAKEVVNLNHFENSNWVLVIGGLPVEGNYLFKIVRDGFTLYRLAKELKVDFTRPINSLILSSVGGLSSPEGWGTWSLGDVVRFRFDFALPEKILLRISAAAFGPNVGREFIVKLGEDSQTFVLDAQQSETILELQNPEKLDTIEFFVPSPVSPASLGAGSDRRLLGIGLKEMQIDGI